MDKNTDRYEQKPVPQKKLNYFLFSGGPGAGKTTVIEQLTQLGHLTVPEVARDIIRHQHAIGGNATHDGDRISYTHLMLQKSIDDFKQHQLIEDTIFFDRGLPDLYCYNMEFCNGVLPEVQDAIQCYHYNPQVFIFPPWPEIYCQDSERKQNFEEAIKTWHAVMEGYQACGYSPIEVPKLSVAERVEFILTMAAKRL